MIGMGENGIYIGSGWKGPAGAAGHQDVWRE